MIDEKIKNLEEQIVSLKKEIERLKNKDCHGKLTNCEYSRMFLEFTTSLDREVKPLNDLTASVFEDDEIIEERILQVLPLLVMSMTNIQNRILLTLQESISKISSSNQEALSDISAAQDQFELIHRNLNRIKIMVSKHDIFCR